METAKIFHRTLPCSCLAFLFKVSTKAIAQASKIEGKLQTGFCPRKPNKNFIALQTTMAKKNNFPLFG
jgi:hypothetical protein